MSGTGLATDRRPRLTTRVLLVCAALAAVQAVLSATVSAVTPAVAAVLPPAYALIAAVHSVMPFLARLLTGASWSATITAGIAGVLMWPVSAVGPLVLVVFLSGAVAFDEVLRGRPGPTVRRMLTAAAASAVVLFVVSLPVFSPGHLTPGMLAATLGARLAAQAAAALGARGLAAALRRVGVRGR